MVDNTRLKNKLTTTTIQGERHNNLEEILKILNDHLTEEDDTIDFCVDFFKYWNRMCINPDENLKSQLETKKKIIENLVNSNLCWIQEFLSSFAFVFLADCYTHVEICELRSGIEYCLEFCKDSKINNKNLKEFVIQELTHIDKALEGWLNDHIETGKVDYKKFITSYPKSHHWWDHLSIKENLFNSP
jgi:hypothetical protein